MTRIPAEISFSSDGKMTIEMSVFDGMEFMKQFGMKLEPKKFGSLGQGIAYVPTENTEENQ